MIDCRLAQLDKHKLKDESIPVWAHDDNSKWWNTPMPKIVLDRSELKLFSVVIDEKQRLSTEIQRHQRCIVTLRADLEKLGARNLAEKFEVSENYVKWKQYEFGYKKAARVTI